MQSTVGPCVGETFIAPYKGGNRHERHANLLNESIHHLSALTPNTTSMSLEVPKLILNKEKLKKYLGFPLPELDTIHLICVKEY